MGLGFAAATLGFVTIYSGFSNQSIADLLTLKGTGGGTKGHWSGTGGGDLGTPTDTGPSPFAPTGDLGKMPAGGTTRFDGLPVSSWIVPILSWARNHGWGGKVTSGYRDPSEVVTPSPGLPVAPQGKSNHNRTYWPGGAVDVTNPDELESVLKRYARYPTLVRGTSIGDPIHFSATGH